MEEITMCYGDPCGLIALWLCYRSEIILMIIGLILVVGLSITAIVMFKKQKRKEMETLGKIISGRVKSIPSISIDEIENEWD